MKLLLVAVLPTAVGAMCLSPRNTAQCTALMNAFSQTSAFGFYQSASCFNFCNGQFQNTNAYFFGANPTCVTGCRLADINMGAAATTIASPASNTASTTVDNKGVSWYFPSSMFGSSSTAAAQVTPPSTTTAYGQVYTPPNPASSNVIWNSHVNSAPAQVTSGANGVQWYVPSNNVAAAQVTNTQVLSHPGAAQVANSYYNVVPAPAPQTVFVTPAHTVAATTINGYNSFAAQQPGRGTIAGAQITGPGGTVNAVITGAGKAVPFARSTNIASGQISRTSLRCSGGKMGSCGKSMSRSRSSVQSYEALAGFEESSSTAPSVALAATSAVILWNVL